MSGAIPKPIAQSENDIAPPTALPVGEGRAVREESSAAPKAAAPKAGARSLVAPNPAPPRRFISSDDAKADEPAALIARQKNPNRRIQTRRLPRADRALNTPSLTARPSDWFPRNWNYQMVGVLGGIFACFFESGQLPPTLSLAMIGLSLLLLASGQLLFTMCQRIERGGSLLASGVTIVLPHFLLGMGFLHWVAAGVLAWELVLAVMLCLGAIASAYLRRHPGAIFCAQLALWAAPVVALESMSGYITLIISTLLAALVTLGQMRELHREAEMRQALDRVQTRARDILADYEETGQGWFWETDRRSLLTYVSNPVALAVGSTPEELIGRPVIDLFDLEDTGAKNERTLMFHLSARSSFRELPVRAGIADEERWWSVSGRPVFDDFNNFVGFRGSGTDLTEKKRSQEHASRLAHFDSLTGLANRLQMSKTLEKILESPQVDNRHCSVLLLDLDRFKHVNDTMGHPAGDALLKQVGERLGCSVGGLGQVGRLGGDEFEVIVPGRSDRDQLGEMGQAIIHALSQPYSIDGQSVVIGVSIGIACSPDDGLTSDDLIRNADLALYAAKDGGRGRFHFFSNDLHVEAEARAQLEQDLRDAIVKGELELYYQPVVHTASEEISGFEALLRWQHPVKGWIPPQKFVEIAEESGLIEQIGEWALRTACHALASWPHDVRVAVNVSPLQFANPQLPTIVASAISQAGINPSRLELEITESVFLADDEGTDAMFAALKRLGVRLALDDFGTGYSSLGYLKKAPFDKIKIDQSFVRGAAQPESRNGAIIASITSLADALGMETTAEGVETLDELDLVRRHGCSHVQGFIYDRPMSAADALARLESGLSAEAHGPRSSRAARQTMLRKVVLDHHGHLYNGTIRNISVTGAMVEGLWNVPVGTQFAVHMSDECTLICTTRWCEEDRLGVEFNAKLNADINGRIEAVLAPPPSLIVPPEADQQ